LYESAQTTVAKVEDELPPDLELPALPRVTAAEVRFLMQINPALAHERIATYNKTWAGAMMDDLGRLKSLARDDAHCRDLQLTYRGVKREHEQATEAAWDAYERCLAEAPPADIRRAAEAHNRAPMLHSFQAVSRGAAAARLRPSARPSGPRYHARPRIRRAAARRAAGARSGQDPGSGEDDPERPPPRGELADLLEEIRPRDLHLADLWWGSPRRLLDVLAWSFFPIRPAPGGWLTHCPACVRGPLLVTERRADHAEVICGHGCSEADIRRRLAHVEALASESIDGEVAA
jgi:hypothetical protein